ncbi:cystatin-like protein [Brachyhypopomus gauderio]|uniref:cystatin-like protein n=1 Tax=Brachyhypopomus gauderio TaxID=698409 RepID=UPI004041B7A2
MKGAVLLSLLVVVTCSDQMWDNYDSLNEHLKKHIDKAIITANKENITGGKHVNYFKIEGTPTVTSHNYYVGVRLRPTTCAAANNESEMRQRNDCKFPPRVTMVIDCVVCTKHDRKELVHCVRFKDLEKEETKESRKQCPKTDQHHAGEKTFLAMKTNIYDQQIGCIGCV